MSEPTQLNPNPQDWRRLLAAAERAAMLQDIARVSLAAGTKLFPEQPWSSVGVSEGAAGVVKSPVEQLAFVEHCFPALAQAVRQIGQLPLTSAAAATRLVRPELARRVTAAAWMSHARQCRSQLPVGESVTLLSVDTPENRAVKSFLNVLMRDCRTIALMAEAEDEPEVLNRALDSVRRLSLLACENWWEEAAAVRGAWTQPPMQRGSLRPDYAAVYRLAGQYRRGFRFEWDHPLLTLPPRETWQLYETWCLLTVFQALSEIGWDCTSAQEVFAVREGRLTLTLEVGQRSEITMKSAQGQALTLAYNRTFAEGREALTHTVRPDITLSDGEQIWILDAKFKPYSEPGEEGDDINQMHAYKDAIVGSRGRSVTRAWCLYAGLTGMPNRAHLTYGRGAETPIGALCLRPGSAETLTNLRRLLQQWLASAHEGPKKPLFPET